MNPTHVHLILNHIPVLFVPLGAGLLAYAVWRPSAEVQRVGLGLMALSAALCIPVYFSGRASEELLVKMIGLPEGYIHIHEEAAEATLFFVLPLGALALWGLYRFRAAAALPGRLLLACFLLALACSAMLARAAFLGGQLRHSEIMPSWKEYKGMGSGLTYFTYLTYWSYQ